MDKVAPVLPTEASSPAQMLGLHAKAVFHVAAPADASHYRENRRKVDIPSPFQVHFSFLTVCQRRREHYDFSNYSRLPGFLAAFRAKILEKQNFS